MLTFSLEDWLKLFGYEVIVYYGCFFMSAVIVRQCLFFYSYVCLNLVLVTRGYLKLFPCITCTYWAFCWLLCNPLL